MPTTRPLSSLQTFHSPLRRVGSVSAAIGLSRQFSSIVTRLANSSFLISLAAAMLLIRGNRLLGSC